MIALVDCNNFYVSCERVFHPHLRNKPVIVLSNNDGCAISRSEEAKELGIQMAAPAFLMEDFLCKNDVAVFSSNYTLYGDMSNRVMCILSSFAPAVELYSIDEAFLDFSNYRLSDLNLYVQKIRKAVYQNTGIPVGIGVASTKTLAKLANKYAKKNKLETYVLDTPEKTIDVLKETPVGDIWGIGKQYGKLLEKNNYHSAFDLVQAPDAWIRKNLSVVGQRMLFELKGIRTLAWEESPEKKKNICTSRSFKEYLSNITDIEEALANHVAACGKKLRAEQTCAQTMNVFIHTNPFANLPQHYPSINIDLPVPSNATNELLKYALKALRLGYRKGYKYQKAGVIVMDLVPEQTVQSALFDNRNRERDNKVNAVIDAVNKSLGRNLVRYSVQGYNNRWKLKAEKLSQRFTTRIDEVLLVKI